MENIDWKQHLRNAVYNTALESENYIEFMDTMRHVYQLDSNLIKALGFHYALELTNGSIKHVELYETLDNAIDRLKNTWTVFRLSNKVTETYIADDEQYAYVETNDDDYRYFAEMYEIGGKS